MQLPRTLVVVLALAGAAWAGPLVAGTSGQQAEPAFQFASHHLVEFSGPESLFESRVRRAGGVIDYVHAATGIAKISGLSPQGAEGLRRSPGVLSVTQDVRLRLLPARLDVSRAPVSASSDPGAQAHDPTAAFFFPFQWNMRQIQAHTAWAAGYSGNPAVRVAVLDTGIDPFHIDLAGLIDVANSRAFTPSVNPLGPDWGDDHTHGTHVAGTIVTNGIGTSGVAPHTTLMAVKVLDAAGDGTVADVIGGILHAADAGADVINMSLGTGVLPSAPGGGLLTALFNRAVNYANARGALVVSAAGNNGVDLNSVQPIKVVPCGSGAGICVSATGPADVLASYSNYGQGIINIAAPGGDFDPSDVAGSLVLGPCSSLSVIIACTVFGYVFIDGTSMATPHVSGAAALIDAQYGGALTAGQLRTRLQQGADDLPPTGRDPFYGHGRLNVFKAVK